MQILNKHLDNKKKRFYAPEYYKHFKCIAGRCRHSCCIDWEITIDSLTLERYKKFPEIIETVTGCDGDVCFKLSENGRCPHLNDMGLCNIIISHGEGFLSDICARHPRFFHTQGARGEIGLGIACEEACRLILEWDTPFLLVPTDESYNIEETDISDFDPTPEREKILSLTENTSTSYFDKLEGLKAEYNISLLYSISDWCERFLELEILDTGWERTLRRSAFPKESKVYSTQSDKYFSRLLTYFVFRHVSLAKSRDNLRARLAFSILSSEMIRYLYEHGNEQNLNFLIETARMYSSEIEYSEENTAELIFEFESEF